MFRSQAHEGGAEKRILPGGKDRECSLSRILQRGKWIIAPIDFPIQFFCMVRTRSGQPGSLSQSFQQLLGVGRDLEEPLLQFLLAPLGHRSASTSRRSTCSLARTVWQISHQLTEERLLVGQPLLDTSSGRATAPSDSSRDRRWRLPGPSRS